jgi:hypothetical protein
VAESEGADGSTANALAAGSVGRLANVPRVSPFGQPRDRRALNSTGLREHAQPYLEELRQRDLLHDGTDVLFVDRVRSFRRGRGGDRP